MSGEPAASSRAAKALAVGKTLLPALATAVVLAVAHRAAPLHLDTARDLVLAHALVEGHRALGAPTSLAGLVQGSSWIELLALRETLGASVVTTERMVDAGLVLASLGLAPVARSLGRSLTVTGWAAWLWATLVCIDYPILWNLSPTPLLSVVYQAALCLGVVTDAEVAFAVASIALGLLLDLHVAYALLVPLTAAAALIGSRRRGLSLLVNVPVALLVPLAVHLVLSPEAAASNAAFAAGHAALLLGGSLALLAAGHLAEPRLRALPHDRRARRVMGASAAAVLAALSAGAMLLRHPIELRYLAPLVPALAMMLGGALPTLTKRGGRALAALRWGLPALLVVMMTTAALHDERPASALTLREMERITPALRARGLGFSQMFRHARGTDAYRQMATVAAFDRAPAEPAPGLTHDLLLLPLLPGQALPLAEDVSPFLAGTRASLVQYPSALSTDHLDFCWTLPGKDRECEAVDVDPEDRLMHADQPEWESRTYPCVGALLRALPVLPLGLHVSYRLRVDSLAGSRRRRLRALDSDARWRIEAVEGFSADVALPAEALTLPAAGARGFVVLGATLDQRSHYARWLPGFEEDVIP